LLPLLVGWRWGRAIVAFGRWTTVIIIATMIFLLTTLATSVKGSRPPFHHGWRRIPVGAAYTTMLGVVIRLLLLRERVPTTCVLWGHSWVVWMRPVWIVVLLLLVVRMWIVSTARGSNGLGARLLLRQRLLIGRRRRPTSTALGGNDGLCVWAAL
jgi:hypothetical protein